MREKTEVVFRGKWANYMHEYNVNRIREMVSSELGKEIQKDVFCFEEPSSLPTDCCYVPAHYSECQSEGATIKCS